MTGFHGAACEGFAGEASHGGVCRVVGGVCCVNAHFRGGGDGVFAGTEEEEFPLGFLGLVLDALGDVFPGVAGGVRFGLA